MPVSAADAPPPAPRRRLGLIVPPGDGAVPDDARHLYGARGDVDFIARGLGIGGVSPDGFAPVVDRIVALARELRDDGAEAISLMGTSISFYRGAAQTEALRRQMQDATGVPCTTMSHAVLRSLQALGAARVAVATAYIDELNERLVDYLTQAGVQVSAIEGLSMTGVREIFDVTPDALIELGEAVWRRDRRADAVFVSCGGLQTRAVLEPLEARLGVPAIASSPAGFWDLLRSAGLDPSASGYGRLFRLGEAATGAW